MGSPSWIEQLARAYLEKEQARVGLPQERALLDKTARENKSSIEESAARALALQQGQDEFAHRPELRDLTRRKVEAEIRNLDEPNRAATQNLATPHFTQDEQGNVTAFRQNPDGTFTTVELGNHGKPIQPKQGPTAHLTPLVDGQGRIIGTFNNITGAVGQVAGQTTPGAPATVGGAEVRKSPLPATMQQTQGIASTVKDNIAKMDELASNNELVSGPISGTLSKASQAVLGPHGAEGDFDFLGNAVVDLVYIKSGKQINENEMKILRQMIPNRARGNLKQQIKLFGDYADGLLRQYGASDESNPNAAAPATPDAKSLLDKYRK